MKSRVLIIEDNFEVRDNIGEILELAGYNVLLAANGKQGVAMALEHHPHLILCDVMMPELDGFGVVKILNNSEVTRDIPLIFLTAKAEKRDFRKGMSLGAVDYITKPFDDSELLRAIELRIKMANTSKVQSRPQFSNGEKLRSDIQSFIEDKELRLFAAKEYLYRENAYVHNVYYIESGKIKISKTNEMGKTLIVQLASRRNFVGQFDAFRGRPYIADAISLTPVSVRIINKEEFLDFVQSNDQLMSYFNQLMMEEYSQSYNRLLEQAYESVRKKVASSLMALYDLYSPSAIDVSREDIADLAGTAKETTIRTLSEFKTDGLIRIQGSEINILEPEVLRNYPH
ncbi:response regulator [Membranihabitans marinus]|uniref:response regulator n=1 Tax=Membranihabitans marinus TaxID=1227546 RepID=UPI001F01F1D6|nr:response regulator [Membranihabitans marinus]